MGTLIKTLNDYRQRLLALGWDGKLIAQRIAGEWQWRNRPRRN